MKRARASTLKAYSRERNDYTKYCFVSASNRNRRHNRFLYSKYVERKQSELKQNPKSFWKFINEKRSEHGLPTNMFLGETTANSTEAKCNLFADHFSSVFNPDAATDQQIETALRDVPEHIISLSAVEFTDNDVFEALCGMKSSSVPGPDGIPSVM